MKICSPHQLKLLILHVMSTKALQHSFNGSISIYNKTILLTKFAAETSTLSTAKPEKCFFFVYSALLLESGKVQQLGMIGNTCLGNDCEVKFEQNGNGLANRRHQQPALTKHDTEDFNTESHVSMHSTKFTGHLGANEQSRTIEHCN